MILKDNPGIVSEFDVLVHLWDSFYLRKTVTEQKKKKKCGGSSTSEDLSGNRGGIQGGEAGEPWV